MSTPRWPSLPSAPPPRPSAPIAGDVVALASGGLFLVAGFLPWYRIRFGTFLSVTRNGWQSPDAGLSTVAVLAGLLAAVLGLSRLVLRGSTGAATLGDGTSLATSLPIAQITLGALAFLLVTAKYSDQSQFSSIGFLLGWMCSVGVVVGGVLGLALRPAAPTPLTPGASPPPGAAPPAPPRAASGFQGPPPGSIYGYRSELAYRAPPTTNGLAVTAMILGILWIYWIGSALALVFGYVAKQQIDRSGGTQSGRGMAVAGIALGWIGAATFLLLVLATIV
jgi:hypothetical protein